MSYLGKRTMGQRMQDAKRSRGIAGINKSSSAVARAAISSSRYNRRYNSRGNRFNFQRTVGAAKELGYVDVAAATYNMDGTGSIALLNTVAQGAGVTQRVGKKIVMKSLQCRGVMYNNATASANDVAIMIIYDKRPTGALPAITDILTSVNSQAMNNDTNSGRFVVVKRIDDVLLGNTAAAASYTNEMFKGCDFFLNLKGLPTTYKAAATGAIGDIEEGALYIVTVGNNAAGTSAATLSTTFRLRFLDI